MALAGVSADVAGSERRVGSDLWIGSQVHPELRVFQVGPVILRFPTFLTSSTNPLESSTSIVYATPLRLCLPPHSDTPQSGSPRHSAALPLRCGSTSLLGHSQVSGCHDDATPTPSLQPAVGWQPCNLRRSSSHQIASLWPRLSSLGPDNDSGTSTASQDTQSHQIGARKEKQIETLRAALGIGISEFDDQKKQNVEENDDDKPRTRRPFLDREVRKDKHLVEELKDEKDDIEKSIEDLPNRWKEGGKDRSNEITILCIKAKFLTNKENLTSPPKEGILLDKSSLGLR
ncbi:uncharacterized protein LOC131143973 [Malania oleifera]|uniref:uncharacterized protein LOC131143973 n=1 Tax=Malania oleifera TaxID=397392 RepID=UPI0025AE1CC6|nr:uncharacterized protein LOC131143973 [Malania oleifera]